MRYFLRGSGVTVFEPGAPRDDCEQVIDKNTSIFGKKYVSYFLPYFLKIRI